jgi:hypothetical protein
LNDNKKTKVLTEKQQAFLHHLANGADGDLRTAMTLAGYSPNANIHDVVKALNDEIIEITKNYVAANGLKAVNKLVGVLDSPNQLGASNLINAAKEVLDRAGISKKQEQDVNIRLDGVIILPAKGSVKSIGQSDLPIIEGEIIESKEPTLIE